jgi:hypothetical protein
MLSRAPTLARDLGTDLRVARVTTGQEAFRQIRAWLREVDDATA